MWAHEVNIMSRSEVNLCGLISIHTKFISSKPLFQVYLCIPQQVDQSTLGSVGFDSGGVVTKEQWAGLAH